MKALTTLNPFKSLFPISSYFAEDTKISIGDRFARNDNTDMVWVVDRIHNHSDYPLISLIREGYPDLRKVVSQTALQINSEFHRCT